MTSTDSDKLKQAREIIEALKGDPELKKMLLDSVRSSLLNDPERVANNCDHTDQYKVPYGKGESTICATCGTVLVRDSGVTEE